MEHATIESKRTDGLDDLVRRALDAVPAEAVEPMGAMSLVREAGDGQPDVAVETLFRPRRGRWVLDTLEVRIRATGSEATVTRGFLVEALQRFGGGRYTNLCTRDLLPRESFDVSVFFPLPLSILARNLVLLPKQPVPNLVGRLGPVFDALGVFLRERDGGFEAPAWQLRRPLDADAQADAYLIAERADIGASLYAAELPVARSIRIEQSRGASLARARAEEYIDCFISRGLSPKTWCSKQDLAEVGDFIERHFGARLGRGRWAVDATDNPYEQAANGRHGAASGISLARLMTAAR